MKIGIIQGRLSEPIEGFQECPKNWKKEFELLNKLKLNHIEWIVTKKSFDNNPIFTENLSNYPISSICADNLVDSNSEIEKSREYILKLLKIVGLRNRQFDLTEIIEAHPELLGIGIDEDTAIVVQGDKFELIGKSYVAIYDRRIA